MASHDSELDNNIPYEGYCVLTTDLSGGGSKGMYKRMNNMRIFVMPQNTASTLVVSVRRDGENVWQAAGTISLAAANNQEWLVVLYNSLYRTISGFIGMLFDFEYDGYR